MSTESKEAWIRRQALMIANQLPENADEALQVLELAKELVTDWLAPRRTQRVHSLRVVEPEPAVSNGDPESVPARR